jgi:hypothetical protein
MQVVRSRRIAGAFFVLSAVALGSPLVGVFASGASAAPTTTPQPTVKAVRITRRAGTLAPGAKVPTADLGQRVFTDANHGFALASVGQAQYPAATVDGGRTWRTDGPALHINAAEAPLSVLDVGAASRRTVFAYGGGQVIDTTSDGGSHWFGALFNGLVMAVVRGPEGHLVAFIDGSTDSGSAVTWQYVSTDGGHSWHYDSAIGGF